MANESPGMEKGIGVRLVAAGALAALALALFMLNHSRTTAPAERSDEEYAALSLVAKEVDAQVDTVLAGFRIKPASSRKRTVEIPNSPVPRIERAVVLPENVLIVDLNRALNHLAERYNGRSIGSENLKDHTVTLHLRIDGVILETVIFKRAEAPKRIVDRRKRA